MTYNIRNMFFHFCAPVHRTTLHPNTHMGISSSSSDLEIVNIPPIAGETHTPPPREPSSKIMAPETVPCLGVFVRISEGQSVHSAYLFGLHNVPGDRWRLRRHSRESCALHNQLYAQSKARESVCNACFYLRDHDVYMVHREEQYMGATYLKHNPASEL